MTQAVELLLDAVSDAAVRQQWLLLEQAGLPSQSRHRSASNRPHGTVVGVPEIRPDAEPEIAHACVTRLPLTVRLGAPMVFGADPVVLVRLVVPTAGLLDLHAAVARLAGVPEVSLSATGRWTPHVTLSHRLPRSELPQALEVLAQDDLTVRLDAARRWDKDSRRDWVIA